MRSHSGKLNYAYPVEQQKLWEQMRAQQSLPPGLKERLEQAQRSSKS